MMAREIPEDTNTTQPAFADGSCTKSDAYVADDFRTLVEDGALVPCEPGQRPLELPPWFDSDKFKRGQQYFQENYYALFVGKLSGLLIVLAIPTVLRMLMFTKRSDVPVKAFCRYFSTITFMLDWYEGDILEPTSRAHKSLMAVRCRHTAAAYKSQREGCGFISQRDMAYTQFGFMGFPLLSPMKLGNTTSPEGLEGFVHFWRTIGYMLGIEDRFNLCKEDVWRTQELCKKVRDEVFVPALLQPVSGFEEMSRALIDGMWAMVPVLEYDAFLGFTWRLAGMEKQVTPNPNQTFYSKAVLALQTYLHEVLLWSWWFTWILRPLLNFQMWLTVWLTQRMPVLAYMYFGRNLEVSS